MYDIQLWLKSMTYREVPVDRKQFNQRSVHTVMPQFISRNAQFIFDHWTVAYLFSAETPRYWDVIHATQDEYKLYET